MSGSQHNLDISKYSFDEVLELFGMDYNMNAEDMKRAKKKVLMSHPDKSHLDPKYFLFYKKAYEFVVNYYNEKIKHEERSDRKSTAYTPLENRDVGQEQITGVIGKMKKNDFNKTFNDLFETNMAVKPDESRNDWFRSSDAQYSNISNVTKDSMGKAFNQVKQQQGALVRHGGVQMLNSVGGTNLYGNADDVYATSDPFSKLKYDDLRKVHKDQTVLAVSESDFDNIKKYKSLDHLTQERGRQDTAPLSSQESEGIISRQQREHEQMIIRKQHESNIKALEYEKKNKNVIGRFLQLQR
jgi:hypothetical protein